MYKQSISRWNSVRKEFTDNIHDKFGQSVNEKMFDEIDKSLIELDNAFEKSAIERTSIKTKLAEARSIL